MNDFGGQLVSMQGYLRALARRYVSTPADIEDLVSNTNVRALKAQDKFEPGTNMRAWLSIVMRNDFLTAMRRGKWDGGSTEDLAFEMLPSVPAPQGTVIDLHDAMKVVATLPPEWRDALLLVGYGASYEEAAEELCCSVGTVKSRVGRARAAVAEALA